MSGIDGARRRVALGAVAASLAAVLSYAAQRLGTAALGEPDPAAIVASAHTPYYGRLALCLMHAALAGLLVGMPLSEEAAGRWLARAPWLVLAVVLPAALALMAVP